MTIADIIAVHCLGWALDTVGEALC
ncbi:MAG: hypothetical protein AAFR53_03715 [Pseudomonadota bacterium]